MGHLQASEMANMIEGGAISLREALGWHLQYNHYPPLPKSLIGVAERAIDKANQGEWDAKLVLPKGCTVNGRRTMTVGQVAEWLHLGDFISEREW